MYKHMLLMAVLCLISCGGTTNEPPTTPCSNVAPIVVAKTDVDPKAMTAYIEAMPPVSLRQLFIGMSAQRGIPDQMRITLLSHSTMFVTGSGVAVMRPSEKGTFVVTNRHVLEQTDAPTVSFDEGITKITGKIIYIDPNEDVAVVQIPTHLVGLPLQTSYANMQEVFALGYPGLAGKASYQASKGTISNACLVEPGANADHCWIQHTASIDPGSSGGPLITVDRRVVGLNTATAKLRPDVHLSVPAVTIEAALKSAENIRDHLRDKAWMTQQLKDSCYRFVSEISSTNAQPEHLVPYIANQMVTDKGLPAFLSMLSPDLFKMFDEDPYFVLQRCVMMYLSSTFAQNKGIASSEYCDHVNPSDDVTDPNVNARITVNLRNGKPMELTWRFERGSWRLADF